MKTVVVIPAFNEEKNIIDVLKKTCQNLKKKDKIIVVDNNSIDKTIHVIRKSFQNVEILVEKKQGKGNALRRGLKRALVYNPEFIITIDGDGENDPFDIPALIAKAMNSDADMVVGKRKKMRSFRRNILRIIENFWLRIATGYNLTDGSCGLNIIKGNSLEKFKLRSEEYEIEIELILECRRNKMKVLEYPVNAPLISDTRVKRSHIISINDFFDKWMIEWTKSGKCDLPKHKKIFLRIFCNLGLLASW